MSEASKLKIVELGGKRYLLLKDIRTGAMSVVWKAQLTDESANVEPGWLYQGRVSESPQEITLPLVAIKLAKPESVGALKEEARLLNKFKGDFWRERVVQLQENLTNDPVTPALILEWVDGRQIDTLNPSDTPNELEALRAAQHLAKTIELIYKIEFLVVTDTVKANSLFLTSASTIKLIDWGVLGGAEDFYSKTLPIVGRALYRLFTGYSLSDQAESDGRCFGEGEAQARWGKLTYGTQTLIRRLVLKELRERMPEKLTGEIGQMLEAQGKRWSQLARDLVLEARSSLASPADKLNLYDIARSDARPDAVSVDEADWKTFREALEQVIEGWAQRDVPAHDAALSDLRWAQARCSKEAELAALHPLVRRHWFGHAIARGGGDWQTLRQVLVYCRQGVFDAALQTFKTLTNIASLQQAQALGLELFLLAAIERAQETLGEDHKEEISKAWSDLEAYYQTQLRASPPADLRAAMDGYFDKRGQFKAAESVLFQTLANLFHPFTAEPPHDKIEPALAAIEGLVTIAQSYPDLDTLEAILRAWQRQDNKAMLAALLRLPGAKSLQATNFWRAALELNWGKRKAQLDDWLDARSFDAAEQSCREMLKLIDGTRSQLRAKKIETEWLNALEARVNEWLERIKQARLEPRPVPAPIPVPVPTPAPANVDELIVQARQLWEDAFKQRSNKIKHSNLLDQAQQKLRQVLNLAPNHVEAMALYGFMQAYRDGYSGWGKGDFTEAASEFARARMQLVKCAWGQVKNNIEQLQQLFAALSRYQAATGHPEQDLFSQAYALKECVQAYSVVKGIDVNVYPEAAGWTDEIKTRISNLQDSISNQARKDWLAPTLFVVYAANRHPFQEVDQFLQESMVECEKQGLGSRNGLGLVQYSLRERYYSELGHLHMVLGNMAYERNDVGLAKEHYRHAREAAKRVEGATRARIALGQTSPNIQSSSASPVEEKESSNPTPITPAILSPWQKIQAGFKHFFSIGGNDAPAAISSPNLILPQPITESKDSANPIPMQAETAPQDPWQESIEKWHQLLQEVVKNAWRLFIMKEIAGALGSSKNGLDIANEIARLTQNNEQNKDWADLIYVCDHILPGENGIAPDPSIAFLAWERQRENQEARKTFLDSIKANTPTPVAQRMRQVNVSAVSQFKNAVNQTVGDAPRWLLTWRVLTQQKYLATLDAQANRFARPAESADLGEAQRKFQGAKRETTCIAGLAVPIAVILLVYGIIGFVVTPQGLVERAQGILVALGPTVTRTPTPLAITPTTENSGGTDMTPTTETNVSPNVNPSKEPEPSKTPTSTPTDTATATVTNTLTETPTATVTPTNTMTPTATQTSMPKPTATRTTTPTAGNSGQAQQPCGINALAKIGVFSITNTDGVPFSDRSVPKDQQFKFKFILCNGTSSPVDLSSVQVRIFFNEDQAKFKDIAEAQPPSIKLAAGKNQEFVTVEKKMGPHEKYTAYIYYVESGAEKRIESGIDFTIQ